MLVIGYLRTISPLNRRNNSLYFLSLQMVAKGMSAVCPVSNNIFRLYSFNKRASLANIRAGAFCNNDSDRHTMRIHGQMYLGVKPPFVRPMASLPPRAPAAWG